MQSFDLNVFGILAPNIRQTFGLSVPQIDTIATLTSAVPVIFSAHLGYYGDRHDRIRFSIVAGLVWGVTAIVTGLAPVVLVLVVARTVGGVGQLTTETIYPSLLADYYPGPVLGLVFSRYRWIGQGVGLIGGPLAGLFAALFGWRVAFVVLAIPTFVFVGLLFTLHEPVRGASMGYSLGEDPITSVREGFRKVRAIRALRRTWAAAFLFGAGTLPLQAVLNNYFADVYHLGDTARGNISLIFGFGGLAGIVVGGRLTNRLVNQGKVPRLSVVSGLMVVECGVGIVALSVAPALWVAVAMTGLLTIGALGFLPSYTALVAFVTAPRLRAQAYGWSLLFYTLGAIVLQAAVIGPIIDAYGQKVALVVLGLLVALGGLIGVTTRRFVLDDMSLRPSPASSGPRLPTALAPGRPGCEHPTMDHRAAPAETLVGTELDVEVGAPASGGGFVARAPDGRVMFVRHALPGESVRALVTSETAHFLRVDAVAVLRASEQRVDAPCEYAGAGRCGGCDYQHVAPGAQRQLKEALLAEQLRRLAGLERAVTVEALPGSPDGLGWRTRVRFAAGRDGRLGFRQHRSHDLVPVDRCLLAGDAVEAAGAEAVRWPGAEEVEVFAVAEDGPRIVSVRTARRRRAGDSSWPELDAGLVVDGRTVNRPPRLHVEVRGIHYRISAGAFWQVHEAAPATLVDAVVDGLQPEAGESVLDCYSGVGLFSLALAEAVGPEGSVIAVERDATAHEDAERNAEGYANVEAVHGEVTAAAIERSGLAPDLVVLDPARDGAGVAVSRQLARWRPSPRRIAYVACDAASFARDLRCFLDERWSIASLRAFDLFPMTEHLEIVAILTPPGA